MKQLFKYMAEPRNLFEEGFIRLTQPAALNDPFEASFCRKSLDELTGYFDESTALDPEFGEIPFSQYIENRMHHIGIVSLSENKENLLMWAHYANEHKGIVVGIVEFPTKNSIFHRLFRADALINSSWGEEWSPFDGKPKPVSYRKGLRYRNDKFDYDYSNISAQGADRLLHEVFMQKSDEWIYEQEHRVVLRIEQADRIIVPDIYSVENKKIRENIQSSSYAAAGSSKGSYTVDLFEIEDENERMAVALELGKLGRDPNTVYLMKLFSGAINNCLLGLKSPLKKWMFKESMPVRQGAWISGKLKKMKTITVSNLIKYNSIALDKPVSAALGGILHKFYHADRNGALVENQDIVLDENKLSRFGAEYWPVLSQGNIEQMNEAQKREFFLDEIRKEQEFHLYTSRLQSIFAANSINDAIMFAHAVTPIPDIPINIIEIYAENFWSLDMNWLDYKNDHNATMSHYRNYWRARITNNAPQQGERRAPRIEVLVALPAKTGKIVHQVMPPNQSKNTDAASCARV